MKARNQQWNKWVATHPKPRWAHEYNATAHPMAPAANNGGVVWKTAAQEAIDSIYAVPVQNSANYRLWEEVQQAEAQLKEDHRERIKKYLRLKTELEKALAAAAAAPIEEDDEDEDVTAAKHNFEEILAELDDNDLATAERVFKKRKATVVEPPASVETLAAAAGQTAAERLAKQQKTWRGRSLYPTPMTQEVRQSANVAHAAAAAAAAEFVGGRTRRRHSTRRRTTHRSRRY